MFNINAHLCCSIFLHNYIIPYLVFLHLICFSTGPQVHADIDRIRAAPLPSTIAWGDIDLWSVISLLSVGILLYALAAWDSHDRAMSIFSKLRPHNLYLACSTSIILLRVQQKAQRRRREQRRHSCRPCLSMNMICVLSHRPSSARRYRCFRTSGHRKVILHYLISNFAHN